MRAQIIKINTLKSSLKDALGRVYKRFSKTNSEVTVIIKPNQAINHEANKINKSGSSTFVEPGEIQRLQTFSSKILEAREQKQLQLQSMKHLNLDLEQRGDEINIVISKKQILPNVLITSRGHKPTTNNRGSINECTNKSKSKNKIKSLKNTGDEQNQHIEPITSISRKKMPTAEQTKQKQTHSEGSPPQQAAMMDRLAQKAQQSDDDIRDDHDDQYSMSPSDQLSIVESLFIVEDKLNDAIDYIKQNKLFELEEYLYDFKTKYSYMSDRVQIKWRLLMAHCKQNRKEYQRASILYQQVLQMAEASPKSLLVDPADIHHRLGICFTEIKRWNQGIIAFAKALQELQKNQKKTKYAQCLNNLGALYLTASQLQQAQKCFLLSYEIKKEEFPSHSRKLISSLFNLYECNLLMRNFEQADSVLRQIQTILRNMKEVEMLEAGLARRRGKLAFFKGDLEMAKIFYMKGLQLISKKYPYSLQYGELCHNLAIIKLEQDEMDEARELLNIALIRLNFYYTKDSIAIVNMKQTLDLIERLAENQRSINSNSNNSELFQLMEESDQVKQN